VTWLVFEQGLELVLHTANAANSLLKQLVSDKSRIKTGQGYVSLLGALRTLGALKFSIMSMAITIRTLGTHTLRMMSMIVCLGHFSTQQDSCNHIKEQKANQHAEAYFTVYFVVSNASKNCGIL
jgi:hypothetical protein